MSSGSRRLFDEPLCVVGLGYVGLTTACAFANAGLDVIGLDVNQKRVDAVNNGSWPLDPKEPMLPSLMESVVRVGKLRATLSYERAVESSYAFVIAVPTPVYEHGGPSLERLDAAIENIVYESNEPKFIVISSTVPPGTTDRVAEDLADYELTRDRVPLLAHVPERLTPGKLLDNFLNLPRVIGGLTTDATCLASALYELVTDPRDHMLTDATTAEIVKTAENAYRDVQIAFATELSWIAEYHDVDFWQVRQMVNTAPERNVHRVSAGVGGHCLPKDGLLLVSEGQPKETLVRRAREVNEFQPNWIALSIARLLHKNMTDESSEPSVLLMGTAYKAETSDTRNSPAYAIGDVLNRQDIRCAYHDPYVREDQGMLGDLSADKHAVVFVQPHKPYLNPDWDYLRDVMTHPIVVDCTGLIAPPPEDFIFWRIGSPFPAARR